MSNSDWQVAKNHLLADLTTAREALSRIETRESFETFKQIRPVREEFFSGQLRKAKDITHDLLVIVGNLGPDEPTPEKTFKGPGLTARDIARRRAADGRIDELEARINEHARRYAANAPNHTHLCPPVDTTCPA
jgi:hypothetical protein